jgi:hypothetical protein
MCMHLGLAYHREGDLCSVFFPFFLFSSFFCSRLISNVCLRAGTICLMHDISLTLIILYLGIEGA